MRKIAEILMISNLFGNKFGTSFKEDTLFLQPAVFTLVNIKIAVLRKFHKPNSTDKLLKIKYNKEKDEIKEFNKKNYFQNYL